MSGSIWNPNGWINTASSAFISFLQSGFGAIVRSAQNKLREDLSAEDFGAIGDDTTDDTIALQNLFNEGLGRLVKLQPGKVYKCTGALTVKGDVDGQGATLKFYGTTITYLVSQYVVGSLKGFTIDGTNVSSCTNALFVDTDFVQKRFCEYDLSIQNISNSNSTQGVNGALFYKASSASVNLNSLLDIKINVTNVTASANGIIGDTGGSATGILVAFNGVGCDGNVIVRDSIIRGISSGVVAPAEDACGVHIFQGDGTSLAAKGKFLVQNVEVYDAKKRGFKGQAANILFENCVCYGQDTLAGFETYAVNTTFRNCKHLLGAYASFTSTAANTAILDCYADITTSSTSVIMYSGSAGANIDGLTIVSTATYVSRDFGAIQFAGSSKATVNRLSLSGSTNTGSGIILTGTNEVYFNALNLTGFLDGVYLSNNVGKTVISNANVTVTEFGIYRLGNTSAPMFLTDSRITATSSGIYTLSSGGVNSSLVDAHNVKISANANGALSPDNCRYVDCEISSTATTGYGILAGNSIVRQCRITGYDKGVSFSGSTIAEIANNVTIGTTTPYEKVGYVIFVDHDNNFR